MKRSLPLICLLMSVVRVPAQDTKSTKQVAEAPNSTRTASIPASASLTPSQIFSRARPSVVVIVASDQNGQREALGSGFIVSHGRIATNHHVVEGMNQAYVVFSDGDVKPASKVVADSTQQDLIILAVETGNRSPLTFGDELSLHQGDSVYALGAPKGLELSFTNGIVSSFRKSNAQFLIQTTAAIAPGSSGGPLFDLTGRVVGVTTSMLSDAPGIYFSVGVGDVRRLLRTPQGVALPFDEWARQQSRRSPSESANGNGRGQSQDGATAAQSLEDTISWMQDFSQAHGFAMRDGKPVAKNALFANPFHEKPSAAGCAVWSTHDFYGVKPGVVNASVEFFDLGDINPDSVKADEYSNVQFETTDPSGKIDRTVTFDPTITSTKLFYPEGWAKGHTAEAPSSMGWLSFDSVESARRFAAAFKQAVTLCGGTRAPF